MAKSLYALLKKNVDCQWITQAQEAFDNIKQQVLINLPTLAYPDPSLPYDLHCDGSDTGFGACLVQNGRSIAFASKTLTSSAEQNYSTAEKECLAIVWALQHFHPCINRASLNIYTDHMALRPILSAKAPRGRIARWIVALQKYQPYTIIHKQGIHNTDADALSRLTQNIQVTNDISAADFKEYQRSDPRIRLILQQGLHPPFVWNNEILCHSDKKGEVVPVIPNILVEMVWLHTHNKATGEHFGVEKTMEKVKTAGWWPNRKDDVQNWVQCCSECQRFKASDIAILPESKHGNRFGLVIMEYLSKWAVTCALKSFDNSNIAQVLLYKVVLKLGLPTRIISDNGTNYVSEAMRLVCRRLGISRSLTSVEHPQTDGLVERLNRTVKTSLATVVGEYPNTWCEYLPFITFAYNTAQQASTRYSSFEVMYGRKAVLPLLPGGKQEAPKSYEDAKAWAEQLASKIPMIHEEALKNIARAQERQKKQYDRQAKEPHVFQIGDLVARRNHAKMGAFPKERWTGPWIVTARMNQDGTAYRIKRNLQDSARFESAVNIADLRI